MALELTTDLILGIGALAVAAVAIYMFVRATGGTGGSQQGEPQHPGELSPHPVPEVAPGSRHCPPPGLDTGRH